MKFILNWGLALLMAAFASSANASINIGSLVDGVVNQLEDQDYEGGILANGTTLEVGDILFGVVAIQKSYAPPDGDAGSVITGTDADETFTGIFATVVTSKGGDASSGFNWNFAPVTDTDWNSIFGIANARNQGNTMVSVYQNTNDPAYIDNNNPQSGANGTLLWEFGYDPTLIVPDGFWEATAPSDNPLDLTRTDAGSNPGPGEFTLGLNLLHSTTDTVQFDLHDYLNVGMNNDLQGFGQFWDTGNPNVVMPLLSDTDFFLVPNIVPEPTALLVWFGIASATGLVVYRSRRVA